VSDSLSALERKRFITKAGSKRDTRAIDSVITTQGRHVVKASRTVFERLERMIGDWPETRRAQILPAMMELIAELKHDPESPGDRMCITCGHFAINCDARVDSAEHFCRFFSEPLRAVDLRLDCPEHLPQDLK
jgi:hypothetical protein